MTDFPEKITLGAYEFTRHSRRGELIVYTQSESPIIISISLRRDFYGRMEEKIEALLGSPCCILTTGWVSFENKHFRRSFLSVLEAANKTDGVEDAKSATTEEITA